MTEHALDEGGGLATMEFTAHFAGIAEAEARVLKQNRLYRAELATNATGKPPVDDDDDLDGVPGRKRKPRRAKAAAKPP